MYICDNPTCKIWLHKECLEEDVLAKTYTHLIEDGDDTSTNGIARPNGKKSKTKSRYKGLFKSTIKDHGDAQPKVSLTDLRPGADPRTWEEVIKCPKCQTELQ